MNQLIEKHKYAVEYYLKNKVSVELLKDIYLSGDAENIQFDQDPETGIFTVDTYVSNLECLWKESKPFKLKATLGQGAFGVTYQACLHNNCKYIVKFIPIGENVGQNESTERGFERELKIAKLMGDNNIGPKIHTGRICKTTDNKPIGAIVMEQMDMVLGYYLQDMVQVAPDFGITQKLKNMIDKMHNLGYYHLDLHENNIMVKLENPKDIHSKIIDIKIIDYGLAEKKDFSVQTNRILDFKPKWISLVADHFYEMSDTQDIEPYDDMLFRVLLGIDQIPLSQNVRIVLIDRLYKTDGIIGDYANLYYYLKFHKQPFTFTFNGNSYTV